MPKALDVFKTELDLIKDPKIREFVIDVIDTMAPEYFWTAPASTSGRYHPQISLGEGGLIRHTKLAVWWGMELMRVDDWHQDDHDCVLAALLLHDLKKNGDRLVGGKSTVKNCVNIHGMELAREIRMRMFPPGTPVPAIVDDILNGVYYHMGRWTDPNWKMKHSRDVGWRDTSISEVVHLADYCASRRVDVKTMELQR